MIDRRITQRRDPDRDRLLDGMGRNRDGIEVIPGALPTDLTARQELLQKGKRIIEPVPALFNAIYSRTNPTALDPSRKSALTSSISESDLAAFLVTYARSLDDDVLDEIWADCTTFLRDVLSNPFPHRQILPRLVEFAAILGTKLENTNFGDNRRMKKELGVCHKPLNADFLFSYFGLLTLFLF